MKTKHYGMLLFLLALLINCFFWESITRNCIYKFPELRKDIFMGWVPQNHSIKVQGLEGFSRIHFNNIGLRGREVAVKKTGKRILVLGSSYTFAGEVSANKTFVALLEKKYADNGNNVQVINAGIPDASVAEFLYYLPWLTRVCQPDLIVIQLVPKDFSRALRRRNGRHVTLNGKGGFTLEKELGHSFKSRLIERPVYRFLLSHSGLFAYLNIRVRNYISSRQEESSRVVQRSTPSQKDLITDSQALIRIVLNKWRESPIPVSLLILPEGDAFRGLDSSKKEAVLAQALKENCGRIPLSCIDMKEPLLKEFFFNHNLAKGFVNSIPGIGHLNKAGHSVVAEQLFKELGQVSL